MILNNFILLINSLLYLDSNIFALQLSHAYSPIDQVDELYRNIRDNQASTRYKKNIHDEDYVWDGIDNDIDYKTQELRIFYEPSVPRPKQKHRGTKELRQSIYGRLFTRRKNRATQAGYTTNVDTCERYNKNLEKVWTTLTRFIDTDQETPDNMALHNIAILVKAYLDHHALLVKNENIQQKIDNINPLLANVPETLNVIEEVLVRRTLEENDEIPSKIVAVILSHVKTPEEEIYKKCFESSKEKLKFKVKREYERFIMFSDCRRVNKLEKWAAIRQVFAKNNFNESNIFPRQWEEDQATKCSTMARNAFLETMRATINSYIIDLQCQG